ncbi:FG-GAP repeat domain-containing protein [Puia dinghuensis]|uniref:VCBS repeat-containing protein n=1 Tax=Puia dinghuensis TaxID=1792502 RepID=A0A8J2XS45_9BACT|nr:VCBS repeat-containing protein [Puia dinghuensis]GGA92183.1 hypothetical protein GCM10011511_14460 [Puia dinghuensis]
MHYKVGSWVIFFIFLGFLTACEQYHRNRSHAAVSVASIREGERLAKVYCQSCHLFPDPSLADSKSWEKGILPAMGPRLGIFNHNFEQYPSSRRDSNVKKDFYPSAPLLTSEEWQHILDYYSATSPDSLPGQSRPRPIRNGLSLFQVVTPPRYYDQPATTLVRIDTTASCRGLYVYDVRYRDLVRYSPALHPTDSFHEDGAIVDMIRETNGWTACNIGMLNPNNGKFGKLQSLGFSNGGDSGTSCKVRLDSQAIFNHLARPVQLAAGDLNGDGLQDYLVCEFGNLTGALSWLENKGNQRFERHVIRALPGAIRAYIDDFNHDGLPDILALFAQGDEGIFLFTNQGKGVFTEERVLQFPPIYGSSYFELADFNNDGQPDILYTCGDNSDFSPVLKPYHGLYIFLNDGHFHFKQRYFFPINGCYRAMARDFDGDGDLDIAAISFFADYKNQPEEGFVYLENLGGFDFQPYGLPETQQGKWLVMDTGDLDGDGRPDIVLGNFSFFAPATKSGVDFKKGPPFMVLRNKGQKRIIK